MAENNLDLTKIIEARKKKLFKVTLLDGTEIHLKHDAPFFDAAELEGEGKASWVELFKKMTVDEDVDKWDSIVDDDDYGQAVIDVMYEYIRAGVFEQKVKKDTGASKDS